MLTSTKVTLIIDFVECGGKGNTPLMWAAWRNNQKLVDFLIDEGADVTALNNEEMDVLDICVIRLCYETALFLKKKGLKPKPASFYEGKLAVLYDVDLFLKKLEKEQEVDNYKIFHDKIIRDEIAWENRDLVIDPREDWKVT